MATDKELHDLGDAAGLVVGRLIEPVEGMHRVISGRTFKYLGPPGAPVQAAYDTVTGGVYRSIRWTATAIGAVTGEVLARRNPVENPVSDSPSASRVQAVINSLWGDRLAGRDNALAVSLTVRHGDRAVGIDRASLAEAFPNATDHLVVLLHGLGQTEQCFYRNEEGGGIPTVATEAGFTPVPIRFNSGLPVAEAGHELAGLLAGLVEAWPLENPALSFVGYSMGGLLARAALAAGVEAGHAWIENTEHVVTVGTPHHGSILAQGVSVLSRALGIARTSRPLSEFIDGRSAGIYDLQEGDGVATGWEDEADVRHHFVAAVVTDDHRHPFGTVVGDLVVHVSSATGRSITTENVHVIGRRRHFELLAEPEIAHQIIDWLAIPRP